MRNMLAATASGDPARSAQNPARSAEPFRFPLVDLGKRFKIHPAYIPRLAANGGSRLHLAAVGDEPATSGRRA
jgi:hypothetical protein